MVSCRRLSYDSAIKCDMFGRQGSVLRTVSFAGSIRVRTVLSEYSGDPASLTDAAEAQVPRRRESPNWAQGYPTPPPRGLIEFLEAVEDH